MNFIQTIFASLHATPSKVILQEIREGHLVPITCGALLENISQARSALIQSGLKPGDRCVLLGPNSSQWVALDLAIMAEGGIVAPLYSRQTLEEQVAIMKDCSPSLLCCADAELRDAVVSHWSKAPPTLLFDEIFGNVPLSNDHKAMDWSQRVESHSSSVALPGLASTNVEPLPIEDDAPITIIYTSGTSGEAKGAILNIANIDFILQRTTARLEALMQAVKKESDDRVFHYLPFCFAGSWILLMTCLFRHNSLILSMDLSKLAEEMTLAAPHYCLNVPAVLEKIRTGINAQLRQRGGLGLALFKRGQSSWLGSRNGHRRFLDRIWLALADSFVFPKIRQRLGFNLQALICGSAPLAEETQLFFQMIGIPVLQVYGLTETTAICTMDDIHHVVPGCVGPAVPGIEMKLGENDEILVRGPNVFPGYWRRPQATSDIIKNGWLQTGDQGHVDEHGNWKIIGRIKNVIITSGGHNISPEPLEQMVLSALPETEQVMVVGNGRKFLSVIITGEIKRERVDVALRAINQSLPHYKQLRKFHLCPDPFTTENGLLTANRKLKRGAIEAHFRDQIESLYRD